MKAVAYHRTSSATNIGEDKDSVSRQMLATNSYAEARDITIMQDFYDAAVSGSDPVDLRPGFMKMLAYCQEHDIRMILIETASRFARDLMVQLTGHNMLKKLGIDLVPVDSPTYFVDDTPTARMIRQILGAVAEFERGIANAKLKGARDRKREKTGRCEGRKPAPAEAIALARHVREINPQASLRQIAAVLEQDGHLSPSGKRYLPGSIKTMLKGI